MSKALKTTFWVHSVVSLLLGAPLLIVPGRLLLALGWAPIDPLLSRVLGAALLALAWSSFRSWRASERQEVAIVIEMEAAFTVLACVGLGRHLFVARYPLVPWLLFALSLAFALAWGFFLVRRE